MKPTTLRSFVLAALFTVACGGAQPTPGAPPSSSTGSGGNGSGAGSGTGTGGGTGTGSGGDNGGSGGSTGGGTPTPPTGGSDGGTTAMGTVGCAGYVTCLNAAMSDADAMACDSKASQKATQELDAVDQCSLDYCTGKDGAAARCKLDANGNPVNLDGSAAWDQNGNPSGDCPVCLDNVAAGLWGQPCQPTTDPACNASACAMAVDTCKMDTAM